MGRFRGREAGAFLIGEEGEKKEKEKEKKKEKKKEKEKGMY